MKKMNLLLAVTLLSSSVFAEVRVDEDEAPVFITAITLAPTTLAPTITTRNTAPLANNNEMILVRQDAIVALETGVYSMELQNVILKMRHENKDLSELSNEELLILIIEE